MKNTISVLTFCLGLTAATPTFSAEKQLDCSSENLVKVSQEAAKIKDQAALGTAMQDLAAAANAMAAGKPEECAVSLAKAATAAGM